MYSEEKIKWLAKKLRSIPARDVEITIKEWLEQNQPEPVVITVKDLESSTTKYCLIHTEEKLRKVQAELDAIKSQEPVVVGLSDEQWLEVSKISVEFAHECTRADKVNKPYLTTRTMNEKLVSWVENQTFTQSSEAAKTAIEQLGESVSLLEEERNALQNKCELLELELNTENKELEQLKSQQFRPNWDDAPDFANWLAKDSNGQWRWFEYEPFINCDVNRWNSSGVESRIVIKNWQQTLQERPKPTPHVEVGLYKHKRTGTRYWVGRSSFSKTKINGEWIDSVTYFEESESRKNLKDQADTRTLSDFLAKFERVS